MLLMGEDIVRFILSLCELVGDWKFIIILLKRYGEHENKEFLRQFKDLLISQNEQGRLNDLAEFIGVS
jgi:RNase P protein component